MGSHNPPTLESTTIPLTGHATGTTTQITTNRGSQGVRSAKKGEEKDIQQMLDDSANNNPPSQFPTTTMSPMNCIPFERTQKDANKGVNKVDERRKGGAKNSGRKLGQEHLTVSFAYHLLLSHVIPTLHQFPGRSSGMYVQPLNKGVWKVRNHLIDSRKGLPEVLELRNFAMLSVISSPQAHGKMNIHWVILSIRIISIYHYNFTALHKDYCIYLGWIPMSKLPWWTLPGSRHTWHQCTFLHPWVFFITFICNILNDPNPWNLYFTVSFFSKRCCISSLANGFRMEHKFILILNRIMRVCWV